MSQRWPCMLKSRSDMDGVCNIWESIRCLFTGGVSHGSRDIQVESFDDVIYSYLKSWAHRQILVFLAALIYTLP